MALLRLVLGAVFRNRDMRRAQVGYAAFVATEQAYWIALLVSAYHHGGTTLAGVVALAQLVPAALFAPFGAALADRYPPARVQAVAYAVEAAAFAAAAVSLFSGGPDAVSYAFAAIASVAITVTRPCQAVLLPALARAPQELTAANVFSSWSASAALFVAPALTGVLLAVSSPGTVFAASAAAMAVAALIVSRLTPSRRLATAKASGDWQSAGMGAVQRGFEVLRRQPEIRLLVGFVGAQFVVIGALDVLVVALAIGTLGMGSGGAGYLTAAFGAGGLIGGAFALLLLGQRRLVPLVLAAALLWGASFALLAGYATRLSALLLLAVAGAGRSVLDVAGRTLIQRLSPPDALARVFGILEAIAMATLATGAILTPALVGLVGAKPALVVLGVMLPVLGLARLQRLVGAEGSASVPVVEAALLRLQPIFAPLPPATVETLARELEPVEAPRGTFVIRQGDVGDRYYVIADGEADVFVDDRHVSTLRRGDGFGEIALLEDVPRTASVRARTDVRLYALAKEPFLVAVTGHAPSADAAETLARDYVGLAHES